MTTTQPESGYAEVGEVRMYYERHGAGHPLVLLHGAISAIPTSFGAVLDPLAETHEVIAIELQGHGRTADVPGRPLDIPTLADDVAGLLAGIGIEQADFFGYSLGAGVTFDLARRYPELVRRQVLASVSYNRAGLQPGMIDGMKQVTAEALAGSPYHAEYLALAPNAGDFESLIGKIANLEFPDLDDDVVRSIQAPTLLIAGDSDIVQLPHIVKMFQLLGGGVNGDLAGLPDSQLAILPGTSHTMVSARPEVLVPMIRTFLDEPLPSAAR